MGGCKIQRRKRIRNLKEIQVKDTENLLRLKYLKFKNKYLQKLEGNKLIIYFPLEDENKYNNYMSEEIIKLIKTNQLKVELKHTNKDETYLISKTFTLEIVTRKTDPDEKYILPQYYINQKYGKFEFIIEKYFYLPTEISNNVYKIYTSLFNGGIFSAFYESFGDLFGNDSMRLLIYNPLNKKMVKYITYYNDDDIHHYGNLYGYNIFMFYNIIIKILKKKIPEALIFKIIQFSTDEYIDFTQLITMWGRGGCKEFCFIKK